MGRRVVITGQGAICALGRTAPETMAGMAEGRSQHGVNAKMRIGLPQRDPRPLHGLGVGGNAEQESGSRGLRR